MDQDENSVRRKLTFKLDSVELPLLAKQQMDQLDLGPRPFNCG